MSINPVQFRKGRSMMKFMQQYGTEAKVFRALYKARWPHRLQRPQTCALSPRPAGLPPESGLSASDDPAARNLFGASPLPLRPWLLATRPLTATGATSGSPQWTVLETTGGRAACEVKAARWVNVRPGNVKRAINGSCHAIRRDPYARPHRVQAACRFDRRLRLHERLPRRTRR